jgi:hypothetical protein
VKYVLLLCAATLSCAVIGAEANRAGLQPSTAFGPAVCKVGDSYVMLYMSLAKPQGIYAARSDDGLTWRMLHEGTPVITPSGAGYDRDLVGHPFLQGDKNELRAWITGYDRNQKGVKDWRLSIGLAKVPLPPP